MSTWVPPYQSASDAVNRDSISSTTPRFAAEVSDACSVKVDHWLHEGRPILSVLPVRILVVMEAHSSDCNLPAFAAHVCLRGAVNLLWVCYPSCCWSTTESFDFLTKALS